MKNEQREGEEVNKLLMMLLIDKIKKKSFPRETLSEGKFYPRNDEFTLLNFIADADFIPCCLW